MYVESPHEFQLNYYYRYYYLMYHKCYSYTFVHCLNKALVWTRKPILILTACKTKILINSNILVIFVACYNNGIIRIMSNKITISICRCYKKLSHHIYVYSYPRFAINSVSDYVASKSPALGDGEKCLGYIITMALRNSVRIFYRVPF